MSEPLNYYNNNNTIIDQMNALFRAKQEIKEMRKLLRKVRETLRWHVSYWARKDEVMMYNDLQSIDKLLKRKRNKK